MSANNQASRRQFDPIAAASIAAVNSGQRAQRAIRNQINAPALPGVEGAFNQSRNLLTQASGLAPLNVVASGQPPALPGMQGQGGPLGALPTPQQVLGGMGAQGSGPLAGFPAPQQVLPTPQGGFPVPGAGQQGRQTNGSAGSGASSNGGTDSTVEDTGTSDRSMSESR